MGDAKTITLDDAVQAARQLPVDAQVALAHELMERIEDVSTPARPPERQEAIKERLAKPLSSISRDELMDMLRRYNPSL